MNYLNFINCINSMRSMNFVNFIDFIISMNYSFFKNSMTSIASLYSANVLSFIELWLKASHSLTHSVTQRKEGLRSPKAFGNFGLKNQCHLTVRSFETLEHFVTTLVGLDPSKHTLVVFCLQTLASRYIFFVDTLLSISGKVLLFE